MTTNAGENKYVFNPESSEEMVRLINLDCMTTKNMNASFGVMDINQPLDFHDGSFDLVNARFLFSVLKRDAWMPFIAECTRLLRPGGILRLTEMTDIVTTSAAQMHMSNLFHQLLWRQGYDFSSKSGRSMSTTTVLPQFIRNAGYQEVVHIPHALEWSADTDAWTDGYRNGEIITYLFRPMLIKNGFATEEEMDGWQQQMIIDMHAENFCAMQYYMTVIGTKNAGR